ncbi:hypothetical protein A2118_03445 [Candidatus Kaiserbacteria bacterium GWA2_50_9]|uniref:Uncharacterized protein n=1 Tax=Candidatus Kaiserbacteria bacterium GWA2_50_9 TaxID=1798474 RepID=A0A1F6BWB0_9BACT|nr:MAG: hypothetical protein A2118_03445 [Candidatus Kaiserbacteria bacterium GWA2_50_9]HZX33852.1 hypothetical protein [archaeon]
MPVPFKGPEKRKGKDRRVKGPDSVGFMGRNVLTFSNKSGNLPRKGELPIRLSGAKPEGEAVFAERRKVNPEAIKTKDMSKYFVERRGSGKEPRKNG